MSAAPNTRASTLLPQTGPVPGQPLWGPAPRKQPVVPLIALALVTLLFCAPAAVSGKSESSNPLTLMRQTANSTVTLVGLVDKSNETLSKLDQNTRPLREMDDNMNQIAAASDGMNKKTQQLEGKLGTVGGAVKQSRAKLEGVDKKLAGTAASMGELKVTVGQSRDATNAIVGEFDSIDNSIDSMDTSLRGLIKLMGTSAPLTKDFAQNRTVRSVAGGDGHRYGVANVVKDTPVISVVLPMINTLQNGGSIAARKDRAVASNPFIGFMLGRQVPDGTNVGATVLPYDGQHGMPKPNYFVNTPVNGF
jgi:hypothetical protein